ncbi:MAG: ATP-dependent Clp protease proteolytic subunit [Planctomycetes bacterium]|nr:ATP-dependent Clp protease proteolytic subunit [Planctomycetota bacterium]
MPEKHKLQRKGEEKDNEQISLGERLLKSRTILLAEPITKEVAEKVTAKLLLLEQDDESAPINLYVNSPGGDVDAGFAIFDMIRYISAPVRCISNGLTASAAVIVLLAAPLEQRLSLPNSRVLMHQPSTGVRGSTADIRIEANEILKIRKKINNLISEETGQDFEQVKEDTRRNYWIGAEEAKKYGLISRIIESKSELED